MPIACVTRRARTTGRLGASPIQKNSERVCGQTNDVEAAQTIHICGAAESQLKARTAADIEHDDPLDRAEVCAQVRR